MLSGSRILRKGESRLFEPIYNIALISNSMGIAIMFAFLGRVELDESPQNDSAAFCSQFPIVVRYPALTPIRAIAHSTPYDEMHVGFLPKEVAILQPPGKMHTEFKGYGRSVLMAITPVFVDFFEKHRAWIKSQFGGDAYVWPTIFNFARVLRNFISHHAGRVHFDNPAAGPVRWHNLEYSPSDEGKLVISADIDIGDLIILMFEIGDELDRLECPLSP
jgi:hypothetical protein